MATNFEARAQWKRLVAAITIGGLVAVGAAVPVFAAAPSNDDYANASAIGAMPFDTTVTLSQATVESNEPRPCGLSISQSVWFAFTAGSTGVAKIVAYSPNIRIGFYQVHGPAITDLSQIGCAAFSWPVGLIANVTSGTSYAIQLGQSYDSGPVDLHVEIVSPPGNDNFADATPFSAIPFAGSIDMAAATVESSEPTDCSYGWP